VSVELACDECKKQFKSRSSVSKIYLEEGADEYITLCRGCAETRRQKQELENLSSLAGHCRKANRERDDARIAARMLRATLIKIDEERPRDDLRISAALAEIEPYFEWMREPAAAPSTAPGVEE
jgi:hypothetical protein